MRPGVSRSGSKFPESQWCSVRNLARNLSMRRGSRSCAGSFGCDSLHNQPCTDAVFEGGGVTDLDLAAVRAFVTAVDEGQFGYAAAVLGLTQQGVSKRIAKLERQLGLG